MGPFLERRPGLSVKKMRETLKLLLSYEHWYMSKRVPRIDVITAQPAVNELMIQLQENFPREAKKKKITLQSNDSKMRSDSTKKRKINNNQPNKTVINSKSSKFIVEEGCNGYNTAKAHFAMMIPENMEEFGSGDNQSTQYGEEHHKFMFKVQAKRTNRQFSSFAC